MKQQKMLPEVGTKLRTHDKLGDTCGFLISEKNLITRKPSMDCTYQGWVPGHGGDVWWCANEDGTIAAYSFTELEYDIDVLQARCQELEAFRLDVATAIQRPKTCSVKGLTVYVRETIKFLENERLEQAAYIKRLEKAHQKVIMQISLNSTTLLDERNQYIEADQKAREALEAIKRGD